MVISYGLLLQSKGHPQVLYPVQHNVLKLHVIAIMYKTFTFKKAFLRQINSLYYFQDLSLNLQQHTLNRKNNWFLFPFHLFSTYLDLTSFKSK